MTDETTTEQLTEIEGQAEDTPATEYTPPEGWRVVRFGEQLLPGDVWVNWEGTVSRPDILHGDGTTASGGRYIRQIKPQPQPVPEPVQVREGRWRTRGGQVRCVTPTPAGDLRAKRWPWRDAKYDQTWSNNGNYSVHENAMDLVKYLGPIEAEDKTQPQPADTVDELRSEIHYLQRELGEAKADLAETRQGRDMFAAANREQADKIGALQGEARDLNMEIGGLERKLTQRDARIRDLETLHAAATQAVVDAGKENTDLQHRLNVVAAEWAEQAETIRRLQIELDAAQQVPQAIADRFEEGWNQGTARAVETVLEWLEPIRAVDNEHLANETLQHLPQIMRSLVGLDSPEDVD